MSNSSDGILAFGYDLGGTDSGWKVKEFDRDEYELKVSWYDDEIEDVGQFDEQAARHLLRTAGHAEADTVFDWEKALLDTLGLTFVQYCNWDFPGWILAATHVESGQSSTTDVDNTLRVHNSVRDASTLLEALRVLGLTPTEPEPRWLLASFYG